MVDPAGTTLVEQETRAGDALERAFVLYQSELLGMLYHVVGNSEDASDALQDTFIKCWRNQHRLADVQNLKAWIFRVAMNAGRDLRQTAWRRHKQPLAADQDTVPSRHAGPDQQAERDEQLAELRTAIRQLREEEREVFLLRQNGDMTYDEIAEALRIPTGTVKTRMRLAIIRLREAVAESAYSSEKAVRREASRSPQR